MTTNGNNKGIDRLDLLIDQMAVLTELVTTGFTELKTIARSLLSKRFNSSEHEKLRDNLYSQSSP